VERRAVPGFADGVRLAGMVDSQIPPRSGLPPYRAQQKRTPRRMGACSEVPIRRFAPSQEEEGLSDGSTSAHRLDAHFVSDRLTIPTRVAPEVRSLFPTPPGFGWPTLCTEDQLRINRVAGSDSDRTTKPPISGAQLRAARALLKWSVRDLSAQCHVSRSAIARGEKVDGAPPMQVRNLDAIRRTFEERGIEFLGLEGVRLLPGNRRTGRRMG
jgi:hypothetical protein